MPSFRRRFKGDMKNYRSTCQTFVRLEDSRSRNYNKENEYALGCIGYCRRADTTVFSTGKLQ